MHIKKLLIILILAWASSIAISQTYKKPPNLPAYDFEKWHFGFTIGPEFQNLRISNSSDNIISQVPLEEIPTNADGDNIYYYSETTGITTGFNVGIITSYKLGEYFNLRMIPSLSLGHKIIESRKYYTSENKPFKNKLTADIDPLFISNKIKSTYISCPILIKYKAARIQDMRPYLLAGVNLKYDLSTDKELDITLKKMDVSLELGLGADFYLQSFRFGMEIRFGLGLMNILETGYPEEKENNPYLTSTIDKLKAKTFTIAFNFE